MSTSCETTCLGCGKVYPEDYMDKGIKKCPECLDNLSPRRCTVCNEIQKVPDDFYRKWTDQYGVTKYSADCKTCRKGHKKTSRSLRLEERITDMGISGQRRKERDALVEAYRLKHLGIIADAGMLTEAEWGHTCSYFGGCAICDESHVESRFPWLTPDEGGKYTKRNTIPLCGECVKKIPGKRDPFEWLMVTSMMSEANKERMLNFLIGDDK